MSWLAESRQIDLDEGPIRYRDLGSGPPILFVHGLLVNGNLWRDVAPRLADRFRCIVPDWPLGSHELPMRATADLTPPGIAETVVRFADALGLGPFTVVGNDTGGAIAQMAVARHPDRFARLVLTDCDAFENFLPPRYRYLCWAAHVPGALAVLAQTLRLGFVRQLPIGYGPLTRNPIPAEIAASYVKPASTSAEIRENLSRTLRGVSSKDTLAAAERLREFRNPALLVWSMDDPIFPFEHARRLAALLPNARVEAIRNSRCFVPEDQPAVLAEHIRSFMEATGTAPQNEQRSTSP
jgi:pimeloyl-ACP methyl ester carboxylesterase